MYIHLKNSTNTLWSRKYYQKVHPRTLASHPDNDINLISLANEIIRRSYLKRQIRLQLKTSSSVVNLSCSLSLQKCPNYKKLPNLPKHLKLPNHQKFPNRHSKHKTIKRQWNSQKQSKPSQSLIFGWNIAKTENWIISVRPQKSFSQL